MSFLKHLRSILVLPFNVLIVIPSLITYQWGTVNIAWGLDQPLSAILLLMGVLFLTIGLSLMIKTIGMFHRIGKGTLAPWDPTQKLVVEGIYRHVRNPMITGVFCILLSEVLIIGSFPIAIWFGIFVTLNLVFIPLWEEKDLQKRFGKEYEVYRQNVPRWIPRTTPWEG